MQTTIADPTAETSRDACADSFSWRRVRMVARYWWPRLKNEFIIFLCISVCVSLAGSLLVRLSGSLFGGSLYSISTFLSLGGAAVFGTKSGKEIDITLPATNSEKMVFTLLYSLIVIPAITFGIATLISLCVMGEDTYNIGIRILRAEGIPGVMTPRFMRIMLWSSYTTVFGIIMVTLYSAVFLRRNAVVKSLCIGFGAYFLPSFAAGVYGGVSAFHAGFEAAKNGIEPSPTEIAQTVIESMDIYMTALGATFTAVFLILLWLFIRNYPKRQG